MARRKVRTPSYVHPRKVTKTERIRIEPNPERPLNIRARDLVRKRELNQDPWWFIVHKRGIRRINVGDDPLEARAISHDLIRGTLPERIVYKALEETFRMRPGVDFTFQSSLQGGRMELGGIVADFLFPMLRMILRIQGPTHSTFRTAKKDEQQRLILEEMGYQVLDIDDVDIYDLFKLEEFLRRVFNASVGSISAIDDIQLLYSGAY